MTSVYNAKIELFCKNVKLLLDDLLMLHPADTTLLMCSASYSALSGFYQEDIVKQFTEILKPFSDKILKRDESFFLNKAHEHLPNDQWLMIEIDKIRKIWVDPSTKPETKETIWKYMETFVKIGKSLKMC